MADPRRLRLSVGDTVSSYRLDAVLNIGVFGTTYLARQVQPREPNGLPAVAALRVLWPVAAPLDNGAITPDVGVAVERAARAQIVAEGRTLERLQHPHVVDAHVVELEDACFLFMDWFGGQSVAEWLLYYDEGVPKEIFFSLFLPLIDALRAAHENGLVHANISPDCVLIRDDGSPVLVGFAAAQQAFFRQLGVPTEGLARGFAAHEQYEFAADLLGPWTDVYGLAALMYTVITGTAPVDVTLRASNAGMDMRPAARLAAGSYPPYLLAAVDNALQVERAARPQSMLEFQEQLFGVTTTLTDDLSVPEPSLEAPKVEAPKGVPQEVLQGLSADVPVEATAALEETRTMALAQLAEFEREQPNVVSPVQPELSSVDDADGVSDVDSCDVFSRMPSVGSPAPPQAGGKRSIFLDQPVHAQPVQEQALNTPLCADPDPSQAETVTESPLDRAPGPITTVSAAEPTSSADLTMVQPDDIAAQLRYEQSAAPNEPLPIAAASSVVPRPVVPSPLESPGDQVSEPVHNGVDDVVVSVKPVAIPRAEPDETKDSLRSRSEPLEFPPVGDTSRLAPEVLAEEWDEPRGMPRPPELQTRGTPEAAPQAAPELSTGSVGPAPNWSPEPTTTANASAVPNDASDGIQWGRPERLAQAQMRWYQRRGTAAVIAFCLVTALAGTAWHLKLPDRAITWLLDVEVEAVTPGASSEELAARQMLDALLAAAESAEQQGKRLQPPGDNAFGRYVGALNVDANNGTALTGIDGLVEHFRAEALAARRRGKQVEATAFAEQALQMLQTTASEVRVGTAARLWLEAEVEGILLQFPSASLNRPLQGFAKPVPVSVPQRVDARARRLLNEAMLAYKQGDANMSLYKVKTVLEVAPQNKRAQTLFRQLDEGKKRRLAPSSG
jgi:serine/threonine protein kinase